MNFVRSTILFSSFLFFFVFQGMNVSGQILGGESMSLKNLRYPGNLPKYLLSRKSVVVIDAPMSHTDDRVRSDWKKLAKTAHYYFRKMNVDAIAYYHVDDLFAGVDTNKIFSDLLTKREFKYVILIHEEAKTGGASKYTITVTAYNNKNTIISQNQNAWKIEGTDLKAVLLEMGKDVLRAEMKLANYLIPEDPEFFETTQIIKGKRIPTYAGDLKVETLVVPRFQKFVIEDSSKVDGNYLSEVKAFNDQIDRKNQRLAQIMESYSPLKYQLSDDYDSKTLYKDGHQFALIHIEGTGENIKKTMGYKLDANETDYVTLKSTGSGTIVYSLPIEAVVTKYYVKHVFSNVVYVGLKWDADLTWEESLQNFIFHMKDTLKVK